MTIIAARSGIMACDSCWAWSDGNTLRLGVLQSKITRTKYGVLIGGAGDCSDRDLMRVFELVRAPHDFPSLTDLNNICHSASGLEFLFYFPDRQLWTFCKTAEGAPELYQLKTEFSAIGSGAAIAQTAMEMGGSAHKAVEMACKLDLCCRPPVICEQLAPPKPKRRRK